VWPVTLSGRLPVVALVGHHPTNKLIGREPILHRKNFPPPAMRPGILSGISPRFRRLSRSEGQIAHVLLTRSPLVYPKKGLTARLACVKHAASVRPEPGSNSPSKTNEKSQQNTTPTKRKGAATKETHQPSKTPGRRATPNKRHRLNGTLLSSQGSNTTSKPTQGPTRATQPTLPERQPPFKPVQGPNGTHQPTPETAPAHRPAPPPKEVTQMGSTRSRPPDPQVLRPAASVAARRG
jgi:hypothetical protein